MNINNIVDKAYEGKSIKEILDSPVSAISGISEGDAEKLAAAFGIKTVRDLAGNKYYKAAAALAALESFEA